MRLLACFTVLLLFAAGAPAAHGARALHQDTEAPAGDGAGTDGNQSPATSALTTPESPSVTAEPSTPAMTPLEGLPAAAVATAATIPEAPVPAEASSAEQLAGPTTAEAIQAIVPTTDVVAAPLTSPRPRHHRRNKTKGHRSDNAVTAAASCSWPGHCAGDPCTTYNDCDGSMTCINGRCGTAGTTPPPPPPAACSWANHCLGDPCRTNNDCDGALICVSGKCAKSGAAPPPSAPPPSPTTPTPPNTNPGQGQCPNGWYEATLTVYDAWPYPGSNEWQSYSGGQYLGLFAYKSTSPACNQAGEVYLSSWLTSSNGRTGTFAAGCRWSHNWVANTKIASVFKAGGSPVNINFNTQIAGKTIRVASVATAKANPTNGGTLVLAADTCGDGDCNNCCTNNAKKSPSKMLIDLEKNALKAVFPGISGFVASSITYAGQRAVYAGAMFDAGSITGYPSTVCFKL